jgi:hypothetical protein
MEQALGDHSRHGDTGGTGQGRRREGARQPIASDTHHHRSKHGDLIMWPGEGARGRLAASVFSHTTLSSDMGNEQDAIAWGMETTGPFCPASQPRSRRIHFLAPTLGTCPNVPAPTLPFCPAPQPPSRPTRAHAPAVSFDPTLPSQLRSTDHPRPAGERMRVAGERMRVRCAIR